MRKYFSKNIAMHGIVRAGSALVAICGLLVFCGMRRATVLAAPPNGAHLQIYFIDVEGGQSTLFVTPEGKSLLVDTGWPGNDSRDAGRIAAAAKLAGVSKIDYVLLTHYHTDHTGGVPQLVAKIPVGTFVDHGVNREPGDAPTEQAWEAYENLLATKKYKRIIAKPGEVLQIPGMEVKVVSADGALIEKPLTGSAEPNPACSSAEKPAADNTENLRSLGVVIRFGKLRILDLGDLTKDKEWELMCPINRIGPVDIYVVSHHGWFHSNSPLFLNGIAPRVAIMDNGHDKGGSPAAWDAIAKSPRLEDMWQLHYSDEGAAAHNVPAARIANLSGAIDMGHYIKLTASADGSFTVYNARTKAVKHYAATASR